MYLLSFNHRSRAGAEVTKVIEPFKKVFKAFYITDNDLDEDAKTDALKDAIFQLMFRGQSSTHKGTYYSANNNLHVYFGPNTKATLNINKVSKDKLRCLEFVGQGGSISNPLKSRGILKNNPAVLVSRNFDKSYLCRMRFICELLDDKTEEYEDKDCIDHIMYYCNACTGRSHFRDAVFADSTKDYDSLTDAYLEFEKDIVSLVRTLEEWANTGYTWFTRFNEINPHILLPETNPDVGVPYCVDRASSYVYKDIDKLVVLYDDYGQMLTHAIKCIRRENRDKYVLHIMHIGSSFVPYISSTTIIQRSTLCVFHKDMHVSGVTVTSDTGSFFTTLPKGDLVDAFDTHIASPLTIFAIEYLTRIKSGNVYMWENKTPKESFAAARVGRCSLYTGKDLTNDSTSDE